MSRLFILILISTNMSYVEPPSVSPNSDQGLFFADNELALAQKWRSYMHLVRPLTGKTHCDQATGACYTDHRRINVIDIISEEPEIVDILEFGDHQLGEINTGRILLMGHEEGTVKLEAELAIDGENIRDTFDVHVAELHTVKLSRIVEETPPFSRYSQCAADGPGAYIFDSLEKIEILLGMVKKDGQGNILRGHGQFPIDVQPDGAAELVDDKKGLHLIRMVPERFGQVELRNQLGSSSIQFHFVTDQAIDNTFPTVFVKNAQRNQSSVVTQLIQGATYDVALFPQIRQAPLCGDDARTKKEIRTPANCQFVGAAHPGSEQVIHASEPGECHLVFTLEGATNRKNLKYDIILDVLPGQYGGDPGW